MPDLEDQTVILMFKDVATYEKYKQEVVSCGGRIKNDLGSALMGFTAVVPPASAVLLQLTSFHSSGNLDDNGISSFEFDKPVRIQQQ